MANVVRDISAQVSQVPTPAPYFQLENNNQPKQSIAEKRLNPAAVSEKDASKEESILFGSSTLFLAQLFAQNETQPVQQPTDFPEQTISPFESLLMQNYGSFFLNRNFPNTQNVSI